eukprot:13187704-Heterocapsa_arctica.AAC.1
MWWQPSRRAWEAYRARSSSTTSPASGRSTSRSASTTCMSPAHAPPHWRGLAWCGSCSWRPSPPGPRDPTSTRSPHRTGGRARGPASS